MLYDPRHDHKPIDFFLPHLFLPPSFEGFVAFVTMKTQTDPDGGYDWTKCAGCAVGQYLTMIMAYDPDWRHPDNPVLLWLDEIAEGWGGQWRDARGRFTDDENKVVQWTWKALAQRLDEVASRGTAYAEATVNALRMMALVT